MSSSCLKDWEPCSGLVHEAGFLNSPNLGIWGLMSVKGCRNSSGNRVGFASDTQGVMGQTQNFITPPTIWAATRRFYPYFGRVIPLQITWSRKSCTGVLSSYLLISSRSHQVDRQDKPSSIQPHTYNEDNKNNGSHGWWGGKWHSHLEHSSAVS